MPLYDFDATNPTDDAIVAQYPANERTFRGEVQDAYDQVRDPDSGLLLEGTARIDVVANEAALPGSGLSEGRVALALDTGRRYVYDDSVPGFRIFGAAIGTAAERASQTADTLVPGVEWYESDTGHRYFWNGSEWIQRFIDVATMHDFVQLQDNVAIGGSWTTINGTTNKGAGTDLEVSVDVPSAGLWRIEVFWAIAVIIEITSDDKRAIVNYRLVLSGGSSTEWPAGHAELNSVSDEARPDWQGQLGGTRMIAPATAGATYTFTMQHQETGSGATEQTFGRPDGSAFDGAATHLGAIVLPLGA